MIFLPLIINTDRKERKDYVVLTYFLRFVSY